MSPLKNARHERFVQALLEGRDAMAAYQKAGYAADDGNAARLKSNPKVQARLAELQAEIASETKVTTAGLIAELEDARKKATDLEQLSAAVRAIESKAKISGLLVERKQVEVGGPGSFDHLTDPREIALACVDGCLEYRIEPYHDFRDDDRGRLAEIYLQCMDAFSTAIEELIAEVRGRPLKASFKPPAKALPSPYNSKNRY
jgi:Terminase small subunit